MGRRLSARATSEIAQFAQARRKPESRLVAGSRLLISGILDDPPFQEVSEPLPRSARALLTGSYKTSIDPLTCSVSWCAPVWDDLGGARAHDAEVNVDQRVGPARLNVQALGRST